MYSGALTPGKKQSIVCVFRYYISTGGIAFLSHYGMVLCFRISWRSVESGGTGCLGSDPTLAGVLSLTIGS